MSGARVWRRFRPVSVEAVQLDGSEASYRTIEEMAARSSHGVSRMGRGILIRTMRGHLAVELGDWVILDPCGHLWPYSNDQMGRLFESENGA